MNINDWEYIKFSMRLKEIERSVFATPAKTRKENVAEHSWSMAAIFWILKEDFKKEFPEMNSEKVYDLIQMHDLVEINTGDVSTWVHKDKDQTKEEKESQSLEIIVSLINSEKAIAFKNLFLELEAKETIESKIVKGIDRISPAIQRVFTGQGWKDENLSEKDLDDIQLPRVQFSKVLTSLYEVLKEEAKTSGIL